MPHSLSAITHPFLIDPFAREVVVAIGWTLVHFCWQGLVIALLAWAILTLTRSARIRYAIGCIAMLAMLAAPVATLAILFPERPSSLPLQTPPSLAAVQPVTLTIPSPTPLAPPVATPAWSETLASALPSLVTIWGIGVALLLLSRGIGLISIARLRSTATPITDDAWLARVRRLAASLGIGRTVALLSSARVDCPAVVGLLRPAILWPAAAMSGLTPAQVDALLAHELAHIRRHDFLVNLVQSFVETLLFYHPAVWWLSRRIRQEREHCCDDLAAQAIGDRGALADALVAMESHRQHAISSLAIGSNGGSLMTRVRRLLHTQPSLGQPSPRLTARSVLLLLGIASCGTFATVWSANAAPDAPPTTASSATTAPTAPTRPPAAVEDYRLHPNDVVQVVIMDLAGAGLETKILKRVTETGKVSLPYVGEVVIGNLTEANAERTIAEAYRAAAVMRNANVIVTTIERSDGRVIVLADAKAAAVPAAGTYKVLLPDAPETPKTLPIAAGAVVTLREAITASGFVGPEDVANPKVYVAVRHDDPNAADFRDVRTFVWADATGEIGSVLRLRPMDVVIVSDLDVQNRRAMSATQPAR